MKGRSHSNVTLLTTADFKAIPLNKVKSYQNGSWRNEAI